MAKIYLREAGTHKKVMEADITGKTNRDVENAIIQILKRAPKGEYYVDDTESEFCQTKPEGQSHSIITLN